MSPVNLPSLMDHEFKTCVFVVRNVPPQVKLDISTTAVTTLFPFGSTVNAKWPNWVLAFQSPDMGDGPVGTLLVPGLGGNVGTPGIDGMLPQAKDTMINRMADTNKRDFKNFFIMTLLFNFF